MTIDKNDPKLTSYILGELPEDEAKEIQAAIENDAVLQTEAAEIRQTVAQIETALKNEMLLNEQIVGEEDLSPFIAAKALRAVPLKKYRYICVLAASLFLTVCGSVFLMQSGKITDVAKTEKFAEPVLSVSDKPIFTVPASVSAENADRNLIKVQGQAKSALVPEAQPVPEAQMGRPLINSSPERKIPADISDSGKIINGITAPKSSFSSIRGENNYSGETRAYYAGGEMSGGKLFAEGKPIRGTEMQHRNLMIENDVIIAGRQAGGRMMMVEPRIIIQEEEEFAGQPLSGESFNKEENETYKNTVENLFKIVKTGEFSTFSIDVDTASYGTMRRYIQSGQKVPEDAVRIEEFINYFKYDYAVPKDGKPFAVHTDVADCPWEKKHLLCRIGLKGKEYSTDERPPLNLVFLIDTSGSMSASNRLPLVIKSLTELVEMLQGKDHIAIVTYAGSSSVALPSVSGNEKRAILDALNGLSAGGSTAGAEGIKTAYQTARKYFDKNGQNRVILCTDGDFNVGETDNGKLETMITDEAKSGVFLTILGFGMGNYKDERLKILSMKGNGNYGYIDTPEEARKLLVEGLTGTLFAIAKDVKIQVDFNPAAVAGYRLIGYENRKLRDEDFNNDKVDAGEIGAGHTVTALYEIVPAGVAVPQAIDKSRYAAKEPEMKQDGEPKVKRSETSGLNNSDELLFVKLRYKEPKENKSNLLEIPVKLGEPEVKRSETSGLSDFNFVSGVALFGMLLRHSQYSGDGNFDKVLQLCEKNVKDDKYRKEFIELVKKAKKL